MGIYKKKVYPARLFRHLPCSCGTASTKKGCRNFLVGQPFTPIVLYPYKLSNVY
jgi:hypothetical protein